MLHRIKISYQDATFTPTATWDVSPQNYQPNFITVDTPAAESTGFAMASAPKVGRWVAPAVLGTSLLGGCQRTEKTQMPDGSIVTKHDYDPIGTGAVVLVLLAKVGYDIINVMAHAWANKKNGG